MTTVNTALQAAEIKVGPRPRIYPLAGTWPQTVKFTGVSPSDGSTLTLPVGTAIAFVTTSGAFVLPTASDTNGSGKPVAIVFPVPITLGLSTFETLGSVMYYGAIEADDIPTVTYAGASGLMTLTNIKNYFRDNGRTVGIRLLGYAGVH